MPQANISKEETAERDLLQDPAWVKMKIGSRKYILHIPSFPYLEAYLSFLKHSGPRSSTSTELPTHSDIPFFDRIIYAINEGHRSFFDRMPPDVDSYVALCDSLVLVDIDVLGGRCFRDIYDELRWCLSMIRDWYDEEFDNDGIDRDMVVGVAKRVAANSAFRLVYQYLVGEFATGELGAEDRDADLAFNVAEFVVSRPDIFGWRARMMVRAAFEDRFVTSRRQRAALDRYPIREPSLG